MHDQSLSALLRQNLTSRVPTKHCSDLVVLTSRTATFNTATAIDTVHKNDMTALKPLTVDCDHVSQNALLTYDPQISTARIATPNPSPYHFDMPIDKLDFMLRPTITFKPPPPPPPLPAER